MLLQQEEGAEGYATGFVAEPIKEMPYCSSSSLGLIVTGRDYVLGALAALPSSTKRNALAVPD
jgi:hypothetical protein